MKLKWVITTTAIALIIFVAFLGLASHDSVMAAQDEGSKIEGLLLDRFTADGSADFIVRFAEQADLSAAYSMDWNTRGEFVYNTLRDTAANSQVNAKAILDLDGLKYQTFIAGNELYVWSGTLAVANELAALPEVYFIRATRTYHIDPIVEVKPLENIVWVGDLLANKALTTVGGSTDALDWGLVDTGADQFWSNFGVQGDGMVVANIDTGVQWDHPALDQAFKCGTDPTDPACWLDPSNICGPGGACDNAGHGTHTMGTMVGDDDPGLTYQVGMAPNAQWIACKGCESTSCSEFALNSCADWILAPGADPANRPNVVNNSWGGGCGDVWYQAKVQAWVADGIFPAFSAGNSGSGCNTLGSPGDYQESFGSAAHDSSRTIAAFSSRGPSAFGHDPYTKPNISAPGVDVCSSVPGGGFECVGWSGTSMASPHTAGAVALLWSCNPGLVGQIDTTFQILQNNADAAPGGNCGAPPDGEGNYTYGYGYLNVVNAGISVCGGVVTGTLEGHVYDPGGAPLEGASVTASPGVEGNQVEALTDPNGFYTMDLIVGTYNVTASKVGYASQTVTGVLVEDGLTTVQDFNLTFLGQWTLGPTMCFDMYRLDGEYYPGTGLVYFLGGRLDATTTTGNIYSFDPATETCADTGADMPNPISNYTANLVNDGTNDLLCTFGGRQADGTVTLNVQCYNPNTNAASVVTNLPVGWTGYTPGAQVVLDNMVYIFGGFNSLAAPYMTARTDVYDPVANTFTQLGDLNLARSYIMATSVDGIIYAFGGDTFDGAALIAQVISEKMDPAAGTWDDAGVADLPVAGDEGQAFGFDSIAPYEFANQIVLATLSQWSGSSNVVVLYDVATDSYNQDFPDLLNARRNHAGVFIPIDSVDPADGLPGMWVFGGWFGSDAPPFAPAEFFPMEVTTAAPSIAVDPAALAATLLPDATTTITLTISNNGNAPLDWSIIEIPGTRQAQVPSGVPQRLSPTGIPAPVAPNAAPLVDVIADGSFEAGTPNPYWTEYSLNFGTPLCDVLTCGTGGGTGPRTGAWWSWFGGIAVYEEGYVYQNVTLNPGSAFLSFWLETAVCDSAADYMEVTVDGNQVFYVDGANPACGVVGYALQTVDVSAYADGAVHEIRFHSENFATNAGVSNFFVDDVALDNFGDVTWLSEIPTSGTVPAGESAGVQVTFDATGLTPGQYLAALDVHSNDPATPVVSVPVTLTVESVDLAITKTDSPDPVKVGQDLTYTLLVTNNGLQDATGVSVVDTLPAGVTFVSASVGCTELGGVVTCDVGLLPMGEVASITIVVTPEAEGVISNTATVSGDQLDSNLADNTATQDTTVVPATVFVYLPIMVK
jgi:uncharacterized repeat protein (TIGR01451 family)